MADFPLIHDKNLPVTRENLGLGPQTQLSEVEITKGSVQDYKYDLERQQAIQKEQVAQQHQEYLSRHPELKQVVSDLMCALMMDKPTNVYQYCADFFAGVK